MPASVAIAYHSGFGHTKALAESVRSGAEEVEGVETALVNVDEITDADWDTLDRATAIIFGAPTYMGTASGPWSMFKDRTSKKWMEQAWKNKLAAGFTNSGSMAGDKQSTLLQMAVLAAQQSMVWISLGLMPGNASSEGSPEDLNRIGAYLGAMSQSNVDQGADVAPPASDLRTGAHLGRRVARIALNWAPPADA